MRQQATQEGLVPLKAWVKNALDHVIQECMGEPGLECVWVGDDAIDPLEQAQTLQILVGAGIKTREEARADLGLAPASGKTEEQPVAKRGVTRTPLGKLNPHHDERGRFATANGAVATIGSPARKPQPTRVHAASNDTVATDVSGLNVAQIIEPEPPPIEPPEAPRPAESAPGASTGTVAEAALRGRELPGTAEPGTSTRTMPASNNPTATAKDYAIGLYKGQIPKSQKAVGDGGFIVELSNGSFVTFRPAGQASDKTEATTATVEINDTKINQLNGGRALKLKFPRKRG
jgi:hypothetical protein